MAQKPAPPIKLTWKVKTDLANGGRIHGLRRETGEVFEAPESAMHAQELEGIVERVPAPAAPQHEPETEHP